MELFTNIAFLAAAQGVFLSLVLFFLQRGRQDANRYLALLILFYSLWTAEFAAYFTTHLFSYPHLLFTTNAFPLLFGPLLFFYAQSLRGEHPFRNKWILIHLLPFALHLFHQYPFLSEPASLKLEALRELRNIDNPPRFSRTFFFIESLKFLHLLAYLILTYAYIKTKNAKDNLPSLYQTWVKRLIYGLGLYAIFDLCHLLGIYLFQYDYIFDLARMILISGAIVVYYIGYATLRQPELIAGDIKPPNKISPDANPRYEKSALSADKADHLVKQLLQQMESEKPWLNKELRLVDLAESLGVSKHHLSQLLNESINKNFYDFVNSYRVKAAQQMLHDPAFAHYTILAIAYEAGFKNKASFNTAFKKHSGVTPSVFRRKE